MSFEIDETVRKLELELLNALAHPSQDVRDAVAAMLQRVTPPATIRLKRSCGFGVYQQEDP